MYFTEFRLINFGLYSGEHVIDLRPPADSAATERPITLIGGRNGAGKTTILEAVRLCLYGAAALGKGTKRAAYEAYLQRRIHRQVGAPLHHTFAGVGVGFVHVSGGQPGGAGLLLAGGPAGGGAAVINLARLRFCDEADQRLKHLKARTGLSANLLCRVGFSLSLAEPNIPDPARYPEDSPREIERGTLTGRYDPLFAALLRQRCLRDGLPTQGDPFIAQFRAHMNRGVLLLYQRVKSLPDLCRLVREG